MLPTTGEPPTIEDPWQVPRDIILQGPGTKWLNPYSAGDSGCIESHRQVESASFSQMSSERRQGWMLPGNRGLSLSLFITEGWVS